MAPPKVMPPAPVVVTLPVTLMLVVTLAPVLTFWVLMPSPEELIAPLAVVIVTVHWFNSLSCEPRYLMPLAVPLVLAVTLLVVATGPPRKEAPSKGEWSLPGGRIEPDETPEEAVVRELREETGIDGRVVTFLALVTVEREHATYRIHEYLIAATSTGPPCAGDDASDVRWASLDALARLGQLYAGQGQYRQCGDAERDGGAIGDPTGADDLGGGGKDGAGVMSVPMPPI